MLSNVPERFDSFILWGLTIFTTMATTVVGWLVRRILTNQKQIDKLNNEIAVRSSQRETEMALLERLETDVRELRHEVRDLNKRKGGSL